MQWVKPELVAQIRFVEWTAEGRLRHAAFLGLRPDKSARGSGKRRDLLVGSFRSVANGPSSLEADRPFPGACRKTCQPDAAGPTLDTEGRYNLLKQRSMGPMAPFMHC